LEKSDRTRPHFERALIIAGLPNAGKSTLLRSMFVDPRLGTKGVPPTVSRLRFVTLSRERCLYFRMTSPHEYGDSRDVFLKKIDRAMERAWHFYWRFNLACAMQPRSTAKTPGLVDLCEALSVRFIPERIRVVQIHPRQDGASGTLLSTAEVDRLWKLGAEVVTLDARRPADPALWPNGLFLADFFDFT
jgi:hypothetical protein